MSGKHSPEGQKLFYDTFKHLTTLSTGSVLLMTTFLVRFGGRPEWTVHHVQRAISLGPLLLGLLGYVAGIFEILEVRVLGPYCRRSPTGCCQNNTISKR